MQTLTVCTTRVHDHDTHFLVFLYKQQLTGFRKFRYEAELSKYSTFITSATTRSVAGRVLIDLLRIIVYSKSPLSATTTMVPLSSHCMGSDSSVIGLGEKLLVSSKISSFNFSFGKSSNSISNLKGSSATGSSAGS